MKTQLNKSQMKKAIEEAVKRIKTKEPQFQANSNKAVASHNLLQSKIK